MTQTLDITKDMGYTVDEYKRSLAMKRKNKIPKTETYSLGTLVNWEEIKGMDRRIVWELDKVLALFTKTALSHFANNLTGIPENLTVRGAEITNMEAYSTDENFQRYEKFLKDIVADLEVYLMDESEFYTEGYKQRMKERNKAFKKLCVGKKANAETISNFLNSEQCLSEDDIEEIRRIRELQINAGRRAFEIIGEILPTLWD